MFKKNNQVFSSSRAFSFILLGMSDGDFDLVPSYQRDYVWNKNNAQELLFSIFNGFPIGAISIIEKSNMSDGPYIEIVDGKQRTTTIYKFYINEIPYIDKFGNEVYFKDMTIVDQRHFKNQLTLSVNILSADVSEIDKYRYFYAINFAGIPINSVHKEYVKKRILELESIDI
jgi:uncharacterized protein with ParB-like and HNH nuclease domain